MQWTERADERRFLSRLSREIIAAVAPEELARFDELIAHFFASPCPPRSRRRARPGRRPITPVAPAVLSAMLNLLLIEIQEAAQNDLPEEAMRGLRRLFGAGGVGHERVWMPAAGAGGQRSLALIVYLYTQPVAVRVPLTRLAEVAYQAASIYGLDDESADLLVPAAVARLSLGSDPGAGAG